MVRTTSIVLGLGLALAATAAHAGRKEFGWLYATDTVPGRTVELESRLQEEDGKAGTDTTRLWWMPVIGLTDRLELGLPIELAFVRTTMGSSTQLEQFGAELRWRLSDPDPIESGPWHALLRGAVKRSVTQRDQVRLEADAVLARDLGRIRIAADVGSIAKIEDSGQARFELRPSLGVSVAAVGELRIGAEAYGEFPLDTDGADPWVAVGPNLSWTHGRTWLSGSFLIGLTGIELAPRFDWAIAF